jgi:HAD superfamily hydrolase (TIGR01549 family)
MFDVGGTLVGFEDDTPFAEFLSRVDPPHRFTSAGELRLSMLHTLSTRRDEAVGMVDDNEINNWWRTIFEDLFPDNLTAARHMWELFKHGYFDSLFPDTIPILERLQARGVPMGVVSNYGAHLIYTLYKLNIYDYFQFVLVSSLLGVAKPYAGIFEIAIEKTGVPAERILYVGDNVADDIEATRKVGIDAVLINRPGRTPSTAPLVIDNLLDIEKFVFPNGEAR